MLGKSLEISKVAQKPKVFSVKHPFQITSKTLGFWHFSHFITGNRTYYAAHYRQRSYKLIIDKLLARRITSMPPINFSSGLFWFYWKYAPPIALQYVKFGCTIRIFFNKWYFVFHQFM